ncbi:MAG: carbohydrate-binding domain-containing protein [Bacteroidales bacterium]|nr:carbohydrate-binding domain-containing protein [Bacteroidales bacterium]
MNFKRMVIPVLCLVVLTAGCKKIWEKDDLLVSESGNDEPNDEKIVKPIDEKNSDYEFSSDGAMFIHLKTNAITTENCDTNVAVSGSDATIKAAGTYLVDGTLSDGHIKVDAPEDALVKLVLNGVNITSTDNAPIYVKNCFKAVLIINDGTTNTLTDGVDNDKEGALFSKENLAIAGASAQSGTLTVNAKSTDAIKSKDGLIIKSGNIIVNSIVDGIVGKDFVIVHGGNITANTFGDALKSTDEGSGFVKIDGGVFNLTCLSNAALSDTAKNDAIKAETDITISDGTFKIVTKRNATAKQGFNPWNPGMFEETSNKLAGMHGITCGRDLKILGGDFNLNVYGKGFNADGNIIFNNAKISIVSERHGISSEQDFTIESGSLSINSNWEGIEATNITFAGGETMIVSQDDGINASNTNPSVKVSGGFLLVRSFGDGIDSNGNIEVSGGIVIVSQSGGGNSPIDCGDRGFAFTVTGGTVFAMGSKDMFSESIPSSTSLPMVYSQQLTGGSSLAVDDIVALANPSNFDAAIFISDKLVENQQYNFVVGGSIKGDPYIQDAGFYFPPTLVSGGTKTEVTATMSDGNGGRRL